jgi:YVTN family beta-propeller protein
MAMGQTTEPAGDTPERAPTVRFGGRRNVIWAVLAASVALLAAVPTLPGFHLSSAPEARPAPSGTSPTPLNGPSLILTPANGPVGSTVNASGSGLGADRVVSFSVGGVSVPSICDSDANGSFPGTTGTPCTFTMPPVPGGARVVVATADWRSVATVAVGSSPAPIAYDSHASEIFVSNTGSNNETVIDDSTNTVVANVAVGSSPIGVTADTGKGEVFVANSGTNTVSVINDTSNAVVANITVGTRPVVPIYDPARGEVFVSNSGSDNVSVINDTANAVVATVNVGTWPTGMGYDPALGEIFVVNSYPGSPPAGSLSVISDANNSVVATIGVGSNPYNPMYDPARQELFVVNHASDNVSVISTVNDTVVANIDVGSGPVNLAYDPATGEMLVSDSSSNNLSVINDASNAVVAMVGTGSGPNGVTYDEARNAIYVANTYSNTVTECTTTTANATFTVDAQLTAPAAVEVGQTIAVAGTGFGASAALTGFALNGTALACLSATLGRCAAGIVTTDPTGSFNVTVRVPAVPAAARDRISATDSSGQTASLAVRALSDPIVALPIASPPAVALGGSVTFSAVASQGSGGYSFVWTGLPAGCLTNDQESITCTPLATGTYSIIATATDSNGFSASSPALSFSVYSVYSLTFRETGLPSGTTWGIVVGSQTQTSSTGNITFQEANGSYSFLVLPVTGYVSASTGYAVVNGSNVVVPVSFHLETYPVVFVVVGLPAGSNWSVTISNTTTGFNETRSTVGSSIVVFLSNGTYTVTFTFPAGVTGNVTSTQITVAGRATGTTVGTAVPTLPGSKSSGNGTTAPTPWPYYAVLAIGLGSLVAGIVLAMRRMGPPPAIAPNGEPAMASSPRPSAVPSSPGPIGRNGTNGKGSLSPAPPAPDSRDPLDEVF